MCTPLYLIHAGGREWDGIDGGLQLVGKVGRVPELLLEGLQHVLGLPLVLLVAVLGVQASCPVAVPWGWKRELVRNVNNNHNWNVKDTNIFFLSKKILGSFRFQLYFWKIRIYFLPFLLQSQGFSYFMICRPRPLRSGKIWFFHPKICVMNVLK